MLAGNSLPIHQGILPRHEIAGAFCNKVNSRRMTSQARSLGEQDSVIRTNLCSQAVQFGTFRNEKTPDHARAF
jgi:hypothetical protein